MEYNRLGKTNLLISRVAFGSLRLGSIDNDDEAAKIVRSAYDLGINFFDTSSEYPDCEKLLGDALYDIRKNVFISTTTSAKTSSDIKNDLEEVIKANSEFKNISVVFDFNPLSIF